MKVVERDGGHFLDAIVMMQNEGHSVEFELTKHTEKLIQYENQEHDFPKIISYTKIHDYIPEFQRESGVIGWEYFINVSLSAFLS